MGNAVASVAKFVAKAVITAGGNLVPVIGGPVASWVNSKFAVGTAGAGTLPTGVKIPEGADIKKINTPAQLKALVKQYPEEAKRAGLTVDMIDAEVAEAKEQSKAVGGKVMMKTMGIAPTPAFGAKVSKAVGGKVSMAMPKEAKISKAVGGEPKPKKPRTKAQQEATKRMLEGLKRHKEGKKKE
jgi:hypothetical protein